MLALTCVGILQTTYARPAAACSCQTPTLGGLIDDSDLIADVRVLRMTTTSEPGVGEFTVATLDVWKGERSSTVTMHTNLQTTACGLGELAVGQELRLWGLSHDGAYSATWCRLPLEPQHEVDAALRTAFGEPWSPEEVATGSFVPQPLIDALVNSAIGIAQFVLAVRP